MNENYVAVVGDINVDYLISIKKFPDYDGDVEVEELKMSGGGFGANTAYALSKLGEVVLLFGCVGKDQNGETALSDLKGKVDLSEIIKEGKTGVCFSVIDESGVRRLMTYRGSNLLCDNSKFNLEKIGKAAWIHIAGLRLDNVNFLFKNLKINSWDPGMPFLDSLKDLPEFAERVGYIFLNEREFELLRLKFDAWKSFENIIVKMGEKGLSYFKKGKSVFKMPAFKVKALDSTGAGDAFNAAFIHAMMKKSDVLYALKFASASGAISVMKFGARSVPDEFEIEKFLKGVKE